MKFKPGQIVYMRKIIWTEKNVMLPRRFGRVVDNQSGDYRTTFVLFSDGVKPSEIYDEYLEAI